MGTDLQQQGGSEFFLTTQVAAGVARPFQERTLGMSLNGNAGVMTASIRSVTSPISIQYNSAS